MHGQDEVSFAQDRLESCYNQMRAMRTDNEQALAQIVDLPNKAIEVVVAFESTHVWFTYTGWWFSISILLLMLTLIFGLSNTKLITKVGAWVVISIIGTMFSYQLMNHDSHLADWAVVNTLDTPLFNEPVESETGFLILGEDVRIIEENANHRCRIQRAENVDTAIANHASLSAQQQGWVDCSALTRYASR